MFKSKKKAVILLVGYSTKTDEQEKLLQAVLKAAKKDVIILYSENAVVEASILAKAGIVFCNADDPNWHILKGRAMVGNWRKFHLFSLEGKKCLDANPKFVLNFDKDVGGTIAANL
ncbi:MAG: hypothetical protein OXR68_07610 [Alphaproteobacteria bacterium]|nr:hypothetical protein [Alphaproteobacteria bacterium]MDD9920470.1 hypothetical protein [Alphaproteobacteria bacterium]